MIKLVTVFHRFGRVPTTLVPRMITEDACADTSLQTQIMSAPTALKRQPSSKRKKIKRMSKKKIYLNKKKNSLKKRIQRMSKKKRIQRKSTRKTKRTKSNQLE